MQHTKFVRLIYWCFDHRLSIDRQNFAQPTKYFGASFNSSKNEHTIADNKFRIMTSGKISSKRRGRSSIFDAVEALETQDAQVERKRLADTTRRRDLQRSKAAQSQMGIFGSLMECRILLQRSILAQRQEEQQTEDDKDGDADASAENPDAVVDLCQEILVNLLQARQALSQKQDVVDYAALVLDESQLAEQLQLEYETHREEWKEVLDRRHRDVHLHSGALTNKTQFRVMGSSFWQQVDSVVQHEQTRQQSDSVASFDDSKVYQQMLKDFVTVAAPENLPHASAQQRLLRKKAASNSKSHVDRKASKGRKIRYTHIPKLANFTFPLSRPDSGNASLDESSWFHSLFGGAASVQP